MKLPKPYLNYKATHGISHDFQLINLIPETFRKVEEKFPCSFTFSITF